MAHTLNHPETARGRENKHNLYASHKLRYVSLLGQRKCVIVLEEWKSLSRRLRSTRFQHIVYSNDKRLALETLEKKYPRHVYRAELYFFQTTLTYFAYIEQYHSCTSTVCAFDFNFQPLSLTLGFFYFARYMYIIRIYLVSD